MLLTAGAILLWAIGIDQPAGMTAWRWGALAGVVLVSFLGPVNRRVFAAAERIRHPSPRARHAAALSIVLAASCYLLFTAVRQERDLFAKAHDDCSYLIQMRMLAQGRLWMPAHPLADFFDSFYLLARPVYASMYFPGTALLYLPTVWLGWPTCLLPALASGAVVGLLYLIVTELIDGVAGALAALLLVSLNWFRMLSILLMSQVPLMLLGLLMIWAWLRWRGRRRMGWAAAIGAFAGWAAITRPVDALCFAVPVGVAMLWELRRGPARSWLLTGALVILAAAPFLAVQLLMNRGITGSFFQTPAGLYAEGDHPGTSYGFHPVDPTRRPASVVPQKQLYYANVIAPYIADHQPANLLRLWCGKWFPLLADTVLPVRLLLILLPVGLLGLSDRRRWVVFMCLPLFVLLYIFWTFFLEHYAIILAPAVILLLLLGMRAIEMAWPIRRQLLATAMLLAVLVLCLTSLPEFNREADDETFHSQVLWFVNEQLPKEVKQPAVVLFRFDPSNSLTEEPVYNTDVAWPDDAPVVRAHDLGGRNMEIFRYYAQRQPQRMFYRFDRKTKLLEPLGMADDLAALVPPNSRGASR